MNIRVMSDLHVDVNRTFDFGFNSILNKCSLNIIAGDIAGDHLTEEFFLKTLNVKKPLICVGGNHLGYNAEYFKDTAKTKEHMINFLTTNFTGPIHYLENNFVKVGNFIIFGGVMYTDFNLYGSPELYSRVAADGMNDFVYVQTADKDGYRTITPQDYINKFNIFMNSLNSMLASTTGDVIVVTHFAPSKNSIGNKYNGIYRNLNPAYAVNLEDFIKNNPRIKLWVHGHMHDSFDYKIGSCRVVCYPYGYSWDRTDNSADYIGKVIRL